MKCKDQTLGQLESLKTYLSPKYLTIKNFNESFFAEFKSLLLILYSISSILFLKIKLIIFLFLTI